MANIFDLVDTWNDAGTTYTGIGLNVTDTASNASSLLMDLQVGGVSQFNVKKNGDLRIKGTGVDWVFMGNVMPSEIHFSANGVASYAGVNSSGSKALGFSITSSMSGTADIFLTRKAAASLRLGAADAAAPVAQTFGVQSVVVGTTNTAGANFTIAGSQGTGTGAGGSIIFQVAPAGLTGTAQNALTTALTIGSDRTAAFAAGVSFASFAYFATNKVAINQNGTGDITAGAAGEFSFGSSGVNSPDVKLFRDAANTLALRNGTAAQAFRVYNTYDGTNDERLNIYWSGNNAYILTAGTGSGSSRDLTIGTAANNATLNFWTNASNRWSIGGSTGHFLAGADNTYDIGASGANRPRYVYAGSAFVNKTSTVAALPTAATAGKGAQAYVTDATATTTRSIVAGGGANEVLVMSNGTNWLIVA